MTLEQINQLASDAFVTDVGWVFEHSPWVAERTWPRRPFASVEALHEAMVETIRAASREEQLALLRAHPDLGTRLKMSDASTGEQAGVGLGNLPPAQFERLRSLNAAYRDRFGFPFLFAVKGSTPAQILASLEGRLPREADVEFDEALRQVARIARFRLGDVIGNVR